MGFWLKLIRMQNNYELQKDFFLVFSLALTRTTFFASTTGGGLLRKPMNRLLMGSVNCVSQ